MNKLEFSQELEKYRKKFEKTQKEYIEIKAELKENISLWESKFGGNPYFPIDEKYPKDSYNKPMKMIAQINFSEFPKFDNFPEKGILQFYISAEDEDFGMDFENKIDQANFRIIYFENIIYDENRLITDFSFLDNLNLNSYPGFPISKESKLNFIKKDEYVSHNDYKFYEIFGTTSYEFLKACLKEKEEQCFYNNFNSAKHKIGGYAFFTQKDPRYQNSYADHEILLFQMISDSNLGIKWFDDGVANFFIKKSDLLNLDFSKVIFNWDTY